MSEHGTDPTVLWRLTRGASAAHASILPAAATTTIAWFFDGVMDRAENYDSVDLAIARSEQIRQLLLEAGWTELDRDGRGTARFG
jgi:hypothetical protein